MFQLIRIKRKNRFIYPLEEKNKLKKNKSKNNNKNIKKFNFQDKHYFHYPFVRKVILPLIIVLIIMSLFKRIKRNKKYHKEDININNSNVFNNIKINRTRTRLDREEALKKGKNYLDKCLEGVLFNHKTFQESDKPKITVIVPLYNNQKMIKPVVRSIQNQKMEEIEIIIVNDFSNDNSLQIIEEVKHEDLRIKIINNKKNMGLLYSRCIAVCEAKGKYIINLEHDDLFFDEDLFDALYEETKEGNFDIISFINIELSKYESSINEMHDEVLINYQDNFILHQPELSHYLTIKNNSFQFADIHILGKIIKAEVYKKAVNLLGEERYSTYNSINEDNVSMFVVCQIANSFKHIKKYGIFHFTNFNNSHIIDYENHIKMTIFLCDIIFDLSRNEDKDHIRDILIEIEPFSSEVKIYLSKILMKLIDSPYTKEKYKEKLRKKYEKIRLPN